MPSFRRRCDHLEVATNKLAAVKRAVRGLQRATSDTISLGDLHCDTAVGDLALDEDRAKLPLTDVAPKRVSSSACARLQEPHAPIKAATSPSLNRL